MSDDWQECMDHCVEVAKKAGEMIREALQKDIAVMQKSSPVDLVTETDQKVEQLIISSIKEKYPTHSFIGEESVAAGAPSVLTGQSHLDHRPYRRHHQLRSQVPVCVRIDRLHREERDRVRDLSGQEDISQSMVLTEMNFKKDPEQFKTMMANMRTILTIPVHGIRSPGSAAVNMCLVACGSADAYYHMGIHCWDMAGGAAIVTEAGGVIMDISGGPFDLMSRRLIVASSRVIAERIAKEITEFHVGRDDAGD
ncbi:Inositol monophosphatase 1 [Larimichthys crocea]|uniref:Inositol-1-monophosphatase n=1 Tax=Larimichthys crocea TaxID=215358 RepID=A0A6G0HKF0_LARCR|nr:Inositol monophosphatase 1 [Larimichthys crocea]